MLVLGIAAPVYGIPGGHTQVPEMDPNSMMSALALLSGSVLMISDRFWRK